MGRQLLASVGRSPESRETLEKLVVLKMSPSEFSRVPVIDVAHVQLIVGYQRDVLQAM
jgi:hypothetical protein